MLKCHILCVNKEIQTNSYEIKRKQYESIYVILTRSSHLLRMKNKLILWWQISLFYITNFLWWLHSHISSFLHELGQSFSWHHYMKVWAQHAAFWASPVFLLGHLIHPSFLQNLVAKAHFPIDHSFVVIYDCQYVSDLLLVLFWLICHVSEMMK